MRISRGSRTQYQVLATEKKEKKKKKKGEEEEKEPEDDFEEEDEGDLEEATLTEKELECQICLNVVKKPVLLSCQSHSVCYACLVSLFKHKKKGRDGKKEIHCPTCGIKSGSLRIKDIDDLRVNKGLQQLKALYKDDKKSWENEKIKLQIGIAEMKALKEKEQEKLKNKENEGKEEDLSQEIGDTELVKDKKEGLEKGEKTVRKDNLVEEAKGKEEEKVMDKKKKENEEKNPLELDGEMDVKGPSTSTSNKIERKPEFQRQTRSLKRKEFGGMDALQEDNTVKRVLKKVKM